MRLVWFRVQNYRSINDSGRIDVSRITAILGRNESGKSNVLRGLASLNPPGGRAKLNPVKDFPKHRRLSECTDKTEVVETEWELTSAEQAELQKAFPRANTSPLVQVGRRYGPTLWISFPGLAPLPFDPGEIAASVRKLRPLLKAASTRAGNEQLSSAVDKAMGAVESMATPLPWAQAATPALAQLRLDFADANVEFTEGQEAIIADWERKAHTITSDENAFAKGRAWVAEHIPLFVYLDEFPELPGHQDIAEYLQRVDDEEPTESDINFEKLCKVAGIDPEQLQSLHQADDHESRNQLMNRAGSVVTQEIRRLWKDRQLKVRFNIDGKHLDTFVSDPNAVYDVEVNLDERSRGLRWFFSFYITFSADTDGGDAESAVLLLDEPGLFLHALSQQDLLRHFEKDFPNNQVIYTTHSPFMVPVEHLDWVRTTNITQDKGTTVTNDPTGDSRTLFPLQSALGYSLSQSLFVGGDNLVIEGVTDFWIISAVSNHFRDTGRATLDRQLTLTPAGGAQKVSYMVALLTSERLNVLVLLDYEKQSVETAEDLVKSKLIRSDAVLFVTDAWSGATPSEADVEDLLDPTVYAALVAEAYAKELTQKSLSLNDKIPRIAKRYELAFESLGLQFNKTRPARLFLNKMASDTSSVLSAESADRFERLFNAVNSRWAKLSARSAQPFD